MYWYNGEKTSSVSVIERFLLLCPLFRVFVTSLLYKTIIKCITRSRDSKDFDPNKKYIQETKRARNQEKCSATMVRCVPHARMAPEPR